MYLLEIWESFTSANEAFLMSFRKRLKLETSLKPSIENPPQTTENWQRREGPAGEIRVVDGSWHASQDGRSMHKWRNVHQDLILLLRSVRELEKCLFHLLVQ